MRAFHRALRRIFNVDVNNEVVRPDGKTDPLILKELLARFGLADRLCGKTQEALFSSYLSFLEEEMSLAKERGLIRILPGALDLLDILSNQPDFCTGLVTGNLEKGAYIKLDKAGLSGYFRFGGYGSDSEDRTTLTQIGIQRGAQVVAPAPVEGAFVVGDTPFDISHGHAAGASVIAVASARYGMNDLGSHDPDLLIPDLTPGESIIRFMRSKP
jgi:phosphoglycolate phosphatase-like HAD superfamily hydrolase